MNWIVVLWIVVIYLAIGASLAMFMFGANMKEKGAGLRNVFYSALYVPGWLPFLLIGTGMALNEKREQEKARDEMFTKTKEAAARRHSEHKSRID